MPSGFYYTYTQSHEFDQFPLFIDQSENAEFSASEPSRYGFKTIRRLYRKMRYFATEESNREKQSPVRFFIHD